MTDRDTMSRAPDERVMLSTLEQLLAITATDVPTALDQASDLIVRALQSEKVDIFLYDPRREALAAAGTSNTPMGRRLHAIGMDVLPIANDGRAVEVFQTGRSYMTGNADQDPDELLGITQGLGVRSSLLVLLAADGERRGVLSVVTTRRDAYTEGDLHFLEAAANWVTTLMHRASLTEQLAAESAQQARQVAAEELITTLAHDLRRPLVPVTNYLELIARRARREERAQDVEYATLALGAAQRLNGMIGDLLDVARLEQGLFALNRAPVDLVALAQETVGVVQGAERTIALEAPDELVAQVDPQRVRQALENLLTNALRYSPAGSVVEVTVGREERQTGPHAVIRVRDHGPGIAPERMATLFERFHAGPESEGLGLGLYLVRGIAQAHSGTLDVEATPGVGATFRLALPIAPAG
jgi:two-component system OmpR family sensor kinase